MLKLFLLMLYVLSLLVSCGIEQETDLTERRPLVSDGKASIGSFNMLRLGHGQKDFRRLAKLVGRIDYDVFAGIEVMNRTAAHKLVDELEA